MQQTIALVDDDKNIRVRGNRNYIASVLDKDGGDEPGHGERPNLSAAARPVHGALVAEEPLIAGGRRHVPPLQ